MPTAQIYIVRHGETVENRSMTVQGQRDTSLNELGRAQARLVGRLPLSDIPFDVVWSSDLKRAAHTAEIIFEENKHAALAKTKLERRKGLRERCLGQLEGQPHEKLRHAKKHGLIEKDPTAEHAQDYVQRVLSAWSDLMSDPALVDGARVLIVSHGGWISTLVDALQHTGRLEIPSGVEITKCFNASVSIIDLDLVTQKGVLVQYAKVDHLKELTQEFVQENADI